MSSFLKLALKLKIPKIPKPPKQNIKTIDLPNFSSLANSAGKVHKTFNEKTISKTKGLFGIKNPSIKTLKLSNFNNSYDDPYRGAIYASGGALGGAIAGATLGHGSYKLDRMTANFVKNNLGIRDTLKNAPVAIPKGGKVTATLEKGFEKLINKDPEVLKKIIRRYAVKGGIAGTLGGYLFSKYTKNRKPYDNRAKFLEYKSPIEKGINKSIYRANRGLI